jgi:hypothetical protein
MADDLDPDRDRDRDYRDYRDPDNPDRDYRDPDRFAYTPAKRSFTCSTRSRRLSPSQSQSTGALS